MKIAVIGGGASGMMAALTASKQQADVTLFEKNDRVGKKLLMTGNGKCNFSNLDFDVRYYHSQSSRDLQPFFAAFGVKETVEFFEELGMLVKNKNGYLYPASEQASTVLDVLRFSCERARVEIKTCAEVKKITRKDRQFFVEIKEGTEITGQFFDKVILACGSKAGPKSIASGSGYLLAKSFRHTVVETVPALVQLRCEESCFKQLAGVRTDCALTVFTDGVCIGTERGELQLTDYGISGIPVFQFSRFAAEALKEKRKVRVSLDFLPDFSENEYEDFIHKRVALQSGQTAEQFFLGITNKKIIQLFLKLAGLKPDETIGKQNRNKWEKVFALFRDFSVTVKETNPMENAQVTAGGVSMDEISIQMESNLVPGLYFAGELLDIDGRCGGYNLQWAWTSGYLAGSHAAKEKGQAV